MSILSVLKSRFLAVAVLSAACGSQSVLAADPVTPQPAKPAADAPLTDETLLQMLRGMGYEPYETGTFSSGAKYYWVKTTQDSWTFNVRFALSPSKTVVWLQTYLGKVPETSKIQPEALQKLIETQNNGKGRFWVSGTSLYYQLPVDNHHVTPKDLKTWIEEFGTNVKESAQLWQTAGWTIEGKEAVDFKKQLDAADKKRSAVIAECGKAFAPLAAGKPGDVAMIKKAIEEIRENTRKTRDEMRTWKLPTSQVAKDMVKAYEQMLETTHKLLMEEFGEIVVIAGETDLTPEQRMGKLKDVQERINAKEKPAMEAFQGAQAKFVKHYDL